MTREKELACALLWLRNHYDYAAVNVNGLKKHVITRIDRFLDVNPPGIADMMEWREQCRKDEISTSTLPDSEPNMAKSNTKPPSPT